MVISRDTVEVDDGFMELREYRHSYNKDSYEVLRGVAKEIWESANKKVSCRLEQIWLDLPEEPTIPPDPAYVLFPGGKLRDLNEVFPIVQWVELYSLYRWQGYVFVPEGLEEKLAPIVKDVLKQEFKLSFKDEAFLSCHVEPPR